MDLIAAERGWMETETLRRLPRRERARYAQLEALLLEHGGERMVICPDEHRDLLIMRGALCEEPVVLRPGTPRQCHTNVARLARDEGVLACTGYALSADGLWRSHSWARSSAGQLVETTEVREMYFGILLEDYLRREFILCNA